MFKSGMHRRDLDNRFRGLCPVLELTDRDGELASGHEFDCLCFTDQGEPHHGTHGVA